MLLFSDIDYKRVKFFFFYFSSSETQRATSEFFSLRKLDNYCVSLTTLLGMGAMFCLVIVIKMLYLPLMALLTSYLGMLIGMN